MSQCSAGKVESSYGSKPRSVLVFEFQERKDVERFSIGQMSRSGEQEHVIDDLETNKEKFINTAVFLNTDRKQLSMNLKMTLKQNIR